MLVAIADSDSAVSVVIAFAANTIPTATTHPDCPTTWPNRRNMMTPRIVRTHGVNTPPNVPNFVGVVTLIVVRSSLIGSNRGGRWN